MAHNHQRIGDVGEQRKEVPFSQECLLYAVVWCQLVRVRGVNVYLRTVVIASNSAFAQWSEFDLL